MGLSAVSPRKAGQEWQEERDGVKRCTLSRQCSDKYQCISTLGAALGQLIAAKMGFRRRVWGNRVLFGNILGNTFHFTQSSWDAFLFYLTPAHCCWSPGLTQGTSEEKVKHCFTEAKCGAIKLLLPQWNIQQSWHKPFLFLPKLC